MSTELVSNRIVPNNVKYLLRNHTQMHKLIILYEMIT